MHYTIQPRLREDGVLPYPFHADADGFVLRQDFWRGRVHRVIGFVPSYDSHDVALWPLARQTPKAVSGMYLVTADDKGRWSTHGQPVDMVMRDDDDKEVSAPLSLDGESRGR